MQTIRDIDHHLDFAVRKYTESRQIRFAVDKVQTKVLAYVYCFIVLLCF